MSLRLPQGSAGKRLQTGLDTLDYELAGEMAVSLGRAGDRVTKALAAYQAARDDSDARVPALKAAAQAVHAYFIQRELCGLRRHDDAIRLYGIPPEVIGRLGAS
ncbi:MAG: hypothetical protein MEQ84_05005 [Mesorhizobium sp.]|nr:hypothetical protein [Mesorhizobium sp.]